jgi:hypothetical protein
VESISVEPISLVERGTQEPSANEGDGEEEGSEMFEGFVRGRRGCGFARWVHAECRLVPATARVRRALW